MEHKQEDIKEECKSGKDIVKFLSKTQNCVGHISSQMNKVFVEKILRKYLEN